jgi:hypothetical protein
VAHGIQIINIIMSTTVKQTKAKASDQASTPRYAVKSPSRGGARPGAGRKKGSTPRYTLEDLIGHIEHHVGMTFAERVAISYANAIERDDHAGVRDYEKILLGKMVADKQEIETITTEDNTMMKAEAFAEALKSLSNGNKDQSK